MDFKFLPFNVNRSSGAHDLTEAVSQEQDIDDLIIAEQNLRRTLNNDGLATIKVRNLHLAITGITEFSGYVTATIRKGETVFSCNVSLTSTQLDYKTYIQHLGDCAGRIPGLELFAETSMGSPSFETVRRRI